MHIMSQVTSRPNARSTKIARSSNIRSFFSHRALALSQRPPSILSGRTHVDPVRAQLKKTETASTTFEKASGTGRVSYRPQSFNEMVRDATDSIEFALRDGHRRVEVEFPPLPNTAEGYKDASDSYIDANVQLAIAAARNLSSPSSSSTVASFAPSSRRVHIVVPDEGELRRSRAMFASFFDSNTTITMGCLTGNSAGSVWGALGAFLKSTSVIVEPDAGSSSADLFLIINASTVELPSVEAYVTTLAKDRPVILWNVELDTLRADLGLFAFPPKDLHYRFLSTFLPAFYLRPRDYSRTVNVAPFIINYSGAVFREYPGPWQVLLKQDGGALMCVAEKKERYALGEAKEELVTAMGLNTEEEGSAEYFARRGYKVATWWEEDEEKKEESRVWRQ